MLEHVFLSYATRDSAEAALEWHSVIRRAGLECWIDRERLDLRRPIAPQLTTGIARATHILLLDSPASRASRWVRFELDLARRLGVPVRSIQGVSVKWRTDPITTERHPWRDHRLHSHAVGVPTPTTTPEQIGEHAVATA